MTIKTNKSRNSKKGSDFATEGSNSSDLGQPFEKEPEVFSDHQEFSGGTPHPDKYLAGKKSENTLFETEGNIESKANYQTKTPKVNAKTRGTRLRKEEHQGQEDATNKQNQQEKKSTCHLSGIICITFVFLIKENRVIIYSNHCF